jgi:hypothetical protein
MAGKIGSTIGGPNPDLSQTDFSTALPINDGYLQIELAMAYYSDEWFT